MNAVPFDTLKLGRRLEDAGLAASAAAGASGADGFGPCNEGCRRTYNLNRSRENLASR
jgi:hypothetical protein